MEHLIRGDINMNKVRGRSPCLKFIVAAMASIIMSLGVTNLNYDCPVSSQSMIVYAVDGIPDNQSYDNSNAEVPNQGGLQKPDANDVFGNAQITPDHTGYSDGIGNILQKIASFIVATCNYIFIFGLIIHFVVESIMMAFPVMATVMSTKVPVQLYSHECAKVCGVTHSYNAGGKGPGSGGPGGGGPGASANNGNGEQGFVGKFSVYIKERMIILILAGVLLVLCSTGLMPKIITMAINWLIGLFVK